MPNTDREMLEAIVAADDLVHDIANLDEATNDECRDAIRRRRDAFAAAKSHIASTPDTGSDGAADIRGFVEQLESEVSDLATMEHRDAYGSHDTIDSLLDFAQAVQGRFATTPTPSPPIPDCTDELHIDPQNSEGVELDTDAVAENRSVWTCDGSGMLSAYDRGMKSLAHSPRMAAKTTPCLGCVNCRPAAQNPASGSDGLRAAERFAEFYAAVYKATEVHGDNLEGLVGEIRQLCGIYAAAANTPPKGDRQ